MRHGVTLALVAVLVLAPASAPLAAADAPGGTPAASSEDAAAGIDQAVATNHSAPPDPEEDVLGWEDGYWHNESIPVTPEDGYNRTELEMILSRSMARVEYIRGIEFEERPGLRTVSRDTYRSYQTGRLGDAVANTSTKDRLHQNTKFEGLFLVPEDESFYSDFVSNQGGFAGAFYTSSGVPGLNVTPGNIVIIVSEDGRTDEIRETTVGHELVHHLQSTNFDLPAYRQGPTEHAAQINTSITEAGAVYVGQRYSDRCGEEWDCLPEPESDVPTFANLGLVFFSLGPYSNTGNLFDELRKRGGVEAMNGFYENPPVSMEQFLHPEKYPDDTPAEVTYEDRSTDEWEQQAFDRGVNYATFGEVGLFITLWYPSYQAREEVVIGPNYPFESRDTEIQYNFAHPASAGWDGDKMFIYTNDTSADTNETGYVWKIVWDSPEDAVEFRDAYYEVLEFRGGETVGVSENTWRIPENRPYGDAFHVVTEEDTTLIVNAPSVEDLDEVRTDIDLSAAMRTPSPTPTRTEEPTPTPTEASSGGTGTTEPMTEETGDETTTTEPTTGGGTTGTTETPGQPGIGMLGAAVALLIALLASRRLN